MLLASLAMGSAGTICASANVAPRWVVRLYDDYAREDWEIARQHQDTLIQLMNTLRAGIFPAGVKAAMHLLDVCEPWPMAPVQALDEKLLSMLRRRLEAFGLLPSLSSAPT